MNRTRLMTGIAVSAALLAGGAALAADGPPQNEPVIPAVDSGEQVAGVQSRSTTCEKTFASGSGVGRFEWCYSPDGNVVQLEHSAGLEHVGVGTITEGWCVSASGTKRGQTVGSGANVGLDAPIQLSANRVRHFTLDGDLRVTQRFGRSADRKQIAIRMAVKNIGENTLNSVFLTRFIDADLSNTTAGDVWAAADRSVAVYEPGSSRLQLVTKETSFFANSLIFPSFFVSLDEDCYDATADANDEDTGDRAMGILVQLGTIFPDQTKTVTFFYYVAV